MAPNSGTSAAEEQTIKFKINDKEYKVGTEIALTTVLVNYIRDHAHLKGTKFNCLMGACGACTVVVTRPDNETGRTQTISVRACRTMVHVCNGWSIYTIEYLGDRYKGYHELQKAMTGFYGTQCGYCSPGMVMSMYGELKEVGHLTAEKIEKTIDGNICRCTGYRPILDAFKSLSEDASLEQRTKMADIEDSFDSLYQCPTSGKPCTSKCSDKKTSKPIEESSYQNVKNTSMTWKTEEAVWHRPSTVQEIYKILQDNTANEKVMIVVGNTSPSNGPYAIYIDTSCIIDFYKVTTTTPIILGANVSINRCIQIFQESSKMFQGYTYLEYLADHWNRVANTGVRNIGCWAGNLMVKHGNNEFPSDIFLTLAAVGAKIKIGHSSDSSETEVTAEEFIKMDMSKKIILSITLQPLASDVYFRSFKIAPTTANSLAYVSGAFKFKLDRDDKFKVLETPQILFSGITDDFIHASDTEAFLNGKYLSDESTILSAVQKLKDEVVPTETDVSASATYRNSLTQALFYKAVVNILGKEVSPLLCSAGMTLTRGLNSSKQDFDANQDTWPIGQAIPKLESNIQVAGEAEYVNDMEMLHNELYGSFVQSTVARAQIKSIDASAALKVDGVVDFITADDIQGEKNTFVKDRELDPLFTSKEVRYAGQSIGLVVAETLEAAHEASKLVKVEYENVEKPTLTIEDALKKKENDRKLKSPPQKVDVPPRNDTKIKASQKVSGKFNQGSQFPFYMEPLTARVIPVEDGYDVYCTTQGPTDTQIDVAQILGVQSNNINLTIRRIGGGFGGKINRANLLACAAAVAAQKLKRPVRIVMDLERNMSLVGWREPFYSEYEAEFDDDGKLLNVKVKIVGDTGHVTNDDSSQFCGSFIPNVYFSKVWDITPTSVNTDTAANTYIRCPGIVEAVGTMETIIDHIAFTLKKDPTEIREINFKDPAKQKSKFGPRGENLMKSVLFPLLKEQALYDTRRAAVDSFNKENRWRKRGLTMMPALWRFQFSAAFKYQVQVMIYHEDGSVVISHGGVELGQGLNTKVAQVAARYLQIPLNMIAIKPTNMVVGANSGITTGSSGSDVCAFGAKMACEKIRARIDAYKKTLPASSDMEWLPLIQACAQGNVDICERYWTNMKDLPEGYDIYGAACVEAEIDVLTGQYLFREVEIIEDCGRSMSPYVDIGQVEGSFIMGMGLYCCEDVKFNKETGQKVNSSLWNYHPPSALDIPVSFKVTLLPKGDAPNGVVRAKATGEPALTTSFAVVLALRDAIKAARADVGDNDWFDLDTPLTVEKVQQMCKVDGADFKIHDAKQEENPEASLEDGIQESFDIVRTDEIDECIRYTCR